MTKKSSYAVTGGNDYQDSAAGAKRFGTKNGYNGTGVSTGADSRNARGPERPQSKGYSTLSEAEADRPDIPFKSWR